MLKKENLKDIYPLTPMQQGMLFHALYDKDSLAYFNQFSLRLSEEINVRIFENSWNEVLMRYDTLRTVFITKNVPEPVQIILKHQNLDFYFEDIRWMEQSDQKVFLNAYKNKDKARSFDLSKDVLMRIALIQLDKSSFQFICTCHHILTDGWSTGIIMKDFFTIYFARLCNKTPKLSIVPSYKNYINWLLAQDKDEAKRYWKNYLNDYKKPVSLTRRLGQNEQSYELMEYCFKFDSHLSEQLRNIAVRNQVTLSSVVQTIWGILLGKYNLSDDVVFGSVVSGRPQEVKNIDKMVGLFINTIPVRIQLRSEQTIDELLKNVQKQSLAGTNYHYYPLPDIQSLCPLRTALFDHIIEMNNYPLDEGLKETVKKISNSSGIDSVEEFDYAHYDLAVIVKAETEIEILFVYNGTIYSEMYLKEIELHLRRIASSMHVGALLSDIDILSDKEKYEICASKEKMNHIKKQMVVEFDI